ncbi:hypothetical protein NLJ89_g5477 [Agrocybe chaxingu]|uniref:Uncharacterized protein n=1 Tax=Agrocybe chaxingu TaxID=84603 RepID=A0A9W8K777_9AGAR|nr:hypothetical protein NLJ89_g5477 [Agrocybe chaxingu]
MRRHYRIARTEPFDSRLIKTDQRSHNANFYDAYHTLSDFGFTLRELVDIVRDTHEKFEATRLDIWAVMFIHQDCVEAIAHPILRRRIERRAYVLRSWLANAFSIGKLIRYLFSTWYWMETYSQQGEWAKFAKQSNNFLLIFEELDRQQKCNYDEVDYPGLPGPIVEAVGVRQVLRDTLEIVSSLPRCGLENEDVTKAVEIVKRIAPQWDELVKAM